MYIMFTYGGIYVGKQASSNCEDAVHSCILFWKKGALGKKWPVLCQCVWIFTHTDEG